MIEMARLTDGQYDLLIIRPIEYIFLDIDNCSDEELEQAAE